MTKIVVFIGISIEIAKFDIWLSQNENCKLTCPGLYSFSKWEITYLEYFCFYLGISFYLLYCYFALVLKSHGL